MIAAAVTALERQHAQIASDKPTLSTAKRAPIPALESLKKLNQWVVWRHVKRGQETTKEPYKALRPQDNASSTDSATWSTFHEAAHALRNEYERLDGVGFVFKAGGGLAGVDVDDCLDDAGAILEWARPLVAPLLARGAYAEISPSGRGLKFFVRASVPHEAGEGLSATIRDEAGHKIGKLEIYSQGRFFTVTGNRYQLAGDALVDCQEPLSALYLTHKSQTARAEALALDWHEVAGIDARELLGADGIPFRLSATAQTRKLLANALARQAFTKAGSSDTDWSVIRWIVCKGLVLVGYPDDEIAALMWHFEGILNGSKRTKDFLQDVARSTAKWRAAMPHIRPQATRLRRRVDEGQVEERLQLVAAEPRKSRARADRPQKVAGAAGYLEWLRGRADAHTGAVMLSLSEVAAELQISRRSVIRYEKALAGQVERRPYASRQAGCIFLLDASGRGDNIPQTATNQAADTVVTGQEPERVLTPQTATAPEEKKHAAERATPSADADAGAAAPQASGQVEPAARVPSLAPQAPRTIDLTRDEAREQEERERPQARARSTVYDIVKQELAARTVEKRNPKTGALYRGRAPFKPILEAVRAQFPNVREDIVRTVYERLMRPIRREMRQDSQTLAAMGYSDQEVYRRLERARAMLRVAGNPAPQARPGEAPEKHAERVARWENVKRLEWKHLRDAERYVAELERRGLSTEPPPARQRTRREVLQQMEMLTVVPSQDELFTRLAAEPLPTTRAALWEMLERICAARGIDVPAETFTLEELAERVERLRRLAIVA